MPGLLCRNDAALFQQPGCLRCRAGLSWMSIGEHTKPRCGGRRKAVEGWGGLVCVSVCLLSRSPGNLRHAVFGGRRAFLYHLTVHDDLYP